MRKDLKMGFFGKVSSFIQGGVDSVKGEWDKFQRQDDVRAALAMLAYVGGADGEVSDAERKAAVKFVLSAKVFEGFDKGYLEKTLLGFYDKATSDFTRGDLLDEIKGVADEPETIRKTINYGIAMAGADGNFDDTERDAILEVVQAVGLSANEFPKLRR
jgi:tellurite resistance protein